MIGLLSLGQPDSNGNGVEMVGQTYTLQYGWADGNGAADSEIILATANRFCFKLLRSIHIVFSQLVKSSSSSSFIEIAAFKANDLCIYLLLLISLSRALSASQSERVVNFC